MILHALLVSKDDEAAETLIHALAPFGVAVGRSSAAEVAQARLTEERFDQVVVDFDDTETASALLQACRQPAPDRNAPVTVALVRDPSQIRAPLYGYRADGAFFVRRHLHFVGRTRRNRHELRTRGRGDLLPVSPIYQTPLKRRVP